MRAAMTIGVASLLSLRAAVPTPQSHFGHAMGADRRLVEWSQVVSWFRLLEMSSDRIRVEELGKTVEGRPLIAATIAAPDTLRHLDDHIDVQRRLADPRIASDSESLVARGKAVVLITCSIHSTEVASTLSAVEFAYRLLARDTPRMRSILRNTILLLVPSLNPDGVDIVTRWYRRTLGTPFEGTSPPELYHKYTGHDNNRDWYAFTQPETRLVVSQVHNRWHPQIVYDIHQQGMYGSRLFVPPWLDPIEPNVDAILAQEMNMVGTAMAADLTAAGKQGIAIHAIYDFWTPARSYQTFHGGLRILTESASAKLATPVTVRFDQLQTSARERRWNFLEPWPGGEWRLRDIVDDQLIAMESCLYEASIRREDLLRNFFAVGKRAVGRKSPWGFVVAANQRDPGATRRMLEMLDFGMVEIERAPDGAHVIPMTQPYSSHAKALLERQNYPDLRQYPGGPPLRPYDVTAHTLPLLMGVAVEAVEHPVAGPLIPERFALSGPADPWIAANRIWKSGGTVWRDMKSGDFAASARPGWRPLRRPRVGVYKSWVPSADEGWTRWVLEQFGFEYASLRNADVQPAKLESRFDVIVFPDQPASELIDGFKPGAMPPEFTGGLSAGPLLQFANSGGTLVFLNRSTAYAVTQLGVKAVNVVGSAKPSEYYSPGSLLNVVLEAEQPLTLGLPAEIAVWSEHSPVWETSLSAPARYVSSNVLASGWLLGEKLIAGRAALVDAKLGKGRVILFGMRPQYRGQSWQTFKLLFNALVYSQQAAP